MPVSKRIGDQSGKRPMVVLDFTLCGIADGVVRKSTRRAPQPDRRRFEANEPALVFQRLLIGADMMNQSEFL